MGDQVEEQLAVQRSALTAFVYRLHADDNPHLRQARDDASATAEVFDQGCDVQPCWGVLRHADKMSTRVDSV